MGSSEGGVNIEEVARRSPEKIIKDPIDITKGYNNNRVNVSGLFYMLGLSLEQAERMAERIGFSSNCIKPVRSSLSIDVLICVCVGCVQAAEQMSSLYKFLLEKDVTMLEINPLVETDDGKGK